MAFITWSSKLETGVTKVDQQHQKLVAMVNALYEAMKDGSGQDVLGKVLNGLVDYTRTHFATEEALMNQFGYPGLATHKIEHDKLTAQVAELQDLFLGLAQEEAKHKVSIEIEYDKVILTDN